MSEQYADFESMIRRALSPVEPPKELEARLEGTLGSLVDMAAGELDAWEMTAMRDPRNWVRPVAAAAGVNAPALTGLAELIAGRLAPGDWTASLTAPARTAAKVRAAA